MGILSKDTSDEAEAVQLSILRRMPHNRKAAVLQSALRAGLGLRQSGGAEMDPFEITHQVVAALERQGIEYFLGGSLASSLHGEPRFTQDADLVVNLTQNCIPDLVAELSADFYLSEQNLVHFTSGFKVDLMVSRQRPFDRARFQRSQLMSAGGYEFRVATPEDMVVVKLEWFRLGGEVSDRQWRDVLSLLLLSASDVSYMRTWSAELGVADLLERALQEAGLSG